MSFKSVYLNPLGESEDRRSLPTFNSQRCVSPYRSEGRHPVLQQTQVNWQEIPLDEDKLSRKAVLTVSSLRLRSSRTEPNNNTPKKGLPASEPVSPFLSLPKSAWSSVVNSAKVAKQVLSPARQQPPPHFPREEFSNGLEDSTQNTADLPDNKGGQEKVTMDTPGRQSVHHGEEEERGHWGSRVEFILSCVGFSVGLGNVWRFPFLAYENGGGAFLIPYIILLVLVGKPMYFMEAALGQFGQVGPMALWAEMLPAGIGVGVAMVVISLIVAIYYNVIMAYCLMYLFNAFRDVLPWTVCSKDWGADDRCYVRSSNRTTTIPDLEGSCRLDEFGGCIEDQPQTSAEQFWERGVLDISSNGLQVFGDLGEIKLDLAFCLLVSWIVVNLCLAKGIKSSGKVVYFTATFPYVVLLILLVQGCSLPGAGNGLYYLFVPTWSKLGDFNVWRAAASQVFFSLGISWGGIIMFGSYNKFHAKVHIDAHLVSVVDFLTSVIASIVIFSTLGHNAYELGVPVQTVAKGGQGLAFVAYPDALSRMPAPHFWSVMFFSMLFLLGLDSEFALFETVVTALFEAVPSLKKHKLTATSGMCAICFLLGLPCITQGGQYVLDLMDTYGAGLSVLIIAIFELISIMWLYGTNNFCKDVKAMLGFSPNIYFKVCWTFISPLLLLVIFVAGCMSWSKPSYGTVEYPTWGHVIGWILALASIINIPLWVTFAVARKSLTSGWRDAFRPSESWLDRRLNAGNDKKKECSPTSLQRKQSKHTVQDLFFKVHYKLTENNPCFGANDTVVVRENFRDSIVGVRESVDSASESIGNNTVVLKDSIADNTDVKIENDFEVSEVNKEAGTLKVHLDDDVSRPENNS